MNLPALALVFVLPASSQDYGGGQYGGGTNFGGGYSQNAATSVLGQLGEIDRELTTVRLEALELEEKALLLDEERQKHANPRG